MHTRKVKPGISFFNKMSNVFNICLILFLLPLYSNAQDTPTDKDVTDQLQFWTSINTTFRFTDRWGLMGDFHIRRNNFILDPSFYFMRAGGVYWLDNKFSLAGGGALLWLATETEQAGNQFALEKRIYQQILWRNEIRKIVFLQRIRNEQRWHHILDNQTGNIDHTRFTNRVRFLLSGTIKVLKNEKLPRFVVADEILFHFGNEVTYNTFDQNRIFLGISQRFGKGWKYDFGYMLVFQQKYTGYQYDRNHTIRLFFYYSPDLRKKKGADMPHYPISGSE
jgi:hypothetical protein